MMVVLIIKPPRVFVARCAIFFFFFSLFFLSWGGGRGKVTGVTLFRGFVRSGLSKHILPPPFSPQNGVTATVTKGRLAGACLREETGRVWGCGGSFSALMGGFVFFICCLYGQ